MGHGTNSPPLDRSDPGGALSRSDTDAGPPICSPRLGRQAGGLPRGVGAGDATTPGVSRDYGDRIDAVRYSGALPEESTHPTDSRGEKRVHNGFVSMGVYSGLFVLSGATLALELALVRVLSVTTWYYLAFFAISTAMLGLTCGAVYVYLRPPSADPDRIRTTLARSATAFGIVVPATLIMLCLVPLPLTRSVMTLLAALVTGLISAAPFFFTGIATTIALTRTQLPVGRLYAADLFGAAAGCVVGLLGLETMDTPSFVLFCGATAFLAAAAFLPEVEKRQRVRYVAGFVGLVAVAWLNTLSVYAIRPLVVKGGIDRPERILLERWNSYSRVVVFPPELGSPQMWGPSPVMPETQVLQYSMKIDGAAGTVLRRSTSSGDLEHLRYDVTNIAYYLRPRGSVCIIGVGAGRDIQSALVFGRSPILGVELNPVFVDLLKGPFKDVAGIARNPNVTLVVDEARTYLARQRQRFDLIQMSMIDTWAATGAGAFSLSENGLYTLEAWSLFYDRLTDDGLFTVARWFNPRNLSETGRVMSLATAVLLRRGVPNPSDHLAMVTSGPVSSLVMSRRPFSAADLALLEGVADRLQYAIAFAPRRQSHSLLSSIAGASSLDDLTRIVRNEPLNLTPPTDNNPYFFNMLRLSHFGHFINMESGVVRGNLVATGTLVVLIVALTALTGLLIVLPLWLGGRGTSGRTKTGKPGWMGVVYFMAVGTGFMFVELAMVQRLSVFLGHPVYALGVLLATIIASAGAGSLLSERAVVSSITKAGWLALLCAATAIAFSFLLSGVAGMMQESGRAARIAATVLMVAPLGVIMGCFVPVGLRLANRVHRGETPWYWALNGVVSVLCSALAVLVAITSGVQANFIIGGLAYLVTIPALRALARQACGDPPPCENPRGSCP